MMELIVYMGIATIALLVFFSFAGDVMSNAVKSRQANEVQSNARTVMSRIIHDVRSASSVNVVGGGLELDASSKCYFLDSGTVKYYDCVDHATDASLSDASVDVTGLNFVKTSEQIAVTLTVAPSSGGVDPVTLSTTAVPRSALYQ